VSTRLHQPSHKTGHAEHKTLPATRPRFKQKRRLPGRTMLDRPLRTSLIPRKLSRGDAEHTNLCFTRQFVRTAWARGGGATCLVERASDQQTTATQGEQEKCKCREQNQAKRTTTTQSAAYGSCSRLRRTERDRYQSKQGVQKTTNERTNERTNKQTTTNSWR
jgi:hypothetical protein